MGSQGGSRLDGVNLSFCCQGSCWIEATANVPYAPPVTFMRSTQTKLFGAHPNITMTLTLPLTPQRKCSESISRLSLWMWRFIKVHNPIHGPTAHLHKCPAASHAHTMLIPIPSPYLLSTKEYWTLPVKRYLFFQFWFSLTESRQNFVRFLAPSVLIRNSEMATWKRIVACSVGGAGCQSQSSPGIPCWFSCHGAVVGAPWPSVGASWQRWMRRRATGDPASPGGGSHSSK